VAEAAFALMIALARKLRPLQLEMQTVGWAWPEVLWLGFDLSGKTLGLVGVGRVGRALARMAGQRVRLRGLGHGPLVRRQQMAEAGVEKVDDLPDLLGAADVVSLHAVLKAGTKQLIGRAEIKRMKAGALLINVSRGALLDEVALLEALLTGRLGGAGLDV